jgi:hypothetical protein
MGTAIFAIIGTTKGLGTSFQIPVVAARNLLGTAIRACAARETAKIRNFFLQIVSILT